MDFWVVYTFLNVTNTAVINICVQFFGMTMFSFFGYIPRNGIVRSYSDLIFTFLTNCQTVSHHDFILHSHLPCLYLKKK